MQHVVNRIQSKWEARPNCSVYRRMNGQYKSRFQGPEGPPPPLKSATPSVGSRTDRLGPVVESMGTAAASSIEATMRKLSRSMERSASFFSPSGGKQRASSEGRNASNIIKEYYSEIRIEAAKLDARRPSEKFVSVISSASKAIGESFSPKSRISQSRYGDSSSLFARAHLTGSFSRGRNSRVAANLA